MVTGYKRRSRVKGARTIWRRNIDSCARLSINVLDPRGVALNAYVMTVMRIGSDYRGYNIGSLLGTVVSWGKRCSAGGSVDMSNGGTRGSEEEYALGENERRLCLKNFRL